MAGAGFWFTIAAPPSSSSSFDLLLNSEANRLGLLFTDAVSSPRFSIAYNNGYVTLFENKSVLPRAYIVPAGGIQVITEMDRQLDRLRDAAFDPERMVIVSRAVHRERTRPFGRTVSRGTWAPSSAGVRAEGGSCQGNSVRADGFA